MFLSVIQKCSSDTLVTALLVCFLLRLNIHSSSQSLQQLGNVSSALVFLLLPPSFLCFGLGQQNGPAVPVQTDLTMTGVSHYFLYVAWFGLTLSPCWVWGKGIIWSACSSCVGPWWAGHLLPSSVNYFGPFSTISDPCWVQSLDEQVWTSPVWSRGPSQP